MKFIPLLIAFVVVVIYNIIAQIYYIHGESSTVRIIISGVLAIIVYELVRYFTKPPKSNNQ